MMNQKRPKRASQLNKARRRAMQGKPKEILHKEKILIKPRFLKPTFPKTKNCLKTLNNSSETRLKQIARNKTWQENISGVSFDQKEQCIVLPLTTEEIPADPKPIYTEDTPGVIDLIESSEEEVAAYDSDVDELKRDPVECSA